MDTSDSGAQVSPDHLKSMKAAIHTFLQSSHAYDSIRDIVDAYATDHVGQTLNGDYPEEIMKIIKEKGILQQLLAQLKTQPLTLPTERSFNVADGQHFLHVRLKGGRAFVDNIDVSSAMLQTKTVFFAAHFGSQRFRSAMKPCCADPQFDDDFLFEIDATGFGFGESDLIEVSTPFHIAVFRDDSQLNVAELLGENIIDWRRVLKSGFLGLTVELCGRNAGVPAGIIDLQLELISKKRIRYREEDISDRLEKQRVAVTNADREFLVYARRWWSEYQAARVTHKERKVKIFASMSTGRMVPVTHFVFPLQAVFGIDSPQDAARFVSLLRSGLDDTTALNPFDSESHGWLTPFVFLSQRQGNSCNHATLLCSLLLGFGLDAFCAIGVLENGSTCVFVITRVKDAQGRISTSVWNPTSGERHLSNEQQTFKTIDCLFNNKSFFANTQASSSISNTVFDIENEELWKPLNVLKLRMVPKYPPAPLLYEGSELLRVERSLEMKLRSKITTYRDAFGVTTSFDNNTSYVLSQALVLYERQQSSGCASDFTFFENSVKGTLGVGKTFKAVPINVSYLDDTSIIDVVRSTGVGKEILDTVADNVKFAVRAKAMSFPERVYSVWVMIAVTYCVKHAS